METRAVRVIWALCGGCGVGAAHRFLAARAFPPSAQGIIVHVVLFQCKSSTLRLPIRCASSYALGHIQYPPSCKWVWLIAGELFAPVLTAYFKNPSLLLVKEL